MCLHFTHHVLKVFSERPFSLRHIYGHDEHQLFSHYHPCHMSTVTTSLLISCVTMMPTPLLLSSPPACSHSYTLTNVLSLSPFYFVSCIHYTSSALLSFILTTSSPVPLIVRTSRLPIRTLHLGGCQRDDASGLRKFLSNARKCGTSVTLDAAAKSTLGINAIHSELRHHTHGSTALTDIQWDLFLEI